MVSKTRRQRILSGTSPHPPDPESLSSEWVRLVPVSQSHTRRLPLKMADRQPDEQQQSKQKSSRKFKRLLHRWQDSTPSRDANSFGLDAEEESTNMSRDPTTSGTESESGLGRYVGGIQELLASVNDFQVSFEAIPVALKRLEERLEQHHDEVENVHNIVEQNRGLQDEVTEQAAQIDGCKRTIKMMARENDAGMKGLEEQKRALEEQQEKLRFEELEAQRKASEAEEQSKRVLKDQMKAIEQKAKQREENLTQETEAKVQDTIRKWEKEQSRLMRQVKTEKKLTSDLQAQIKTLEDDKDKAIKRQKDSRRLKESFEAENKKLQEKISAVDRLFTCGDSKIADYQNKFRSIEQKIQRLSHESLLDFEDVGAEELENIHRELCHRDVSFRDVPISLSDESVRLCQAHVQRVIAHNIANIIWKPFSSDLLFAKSELSTLLSSLHKHITASSHKGSRQEVFWRVQTFQAFQLLEASNMYSADTRSRNVVTRAGETFKAVIEAVGPLIAPNVLQSFKAQLSEIIELSVTVWDEAAIDENYIEAQTAIEPTMYHECRSELFDPHDETNRSDCPHPTGNLLVLFPRVSISYPAYEDWSTVDSMPGAFPQSDKESQFPAGRSQKTETIHTGRALATESKLVQDGKVELEERQMRIKQAVAKAAEGDQQQRRNRRQSTASARVTLVQSGHSDMIPENEVAKTLPAQNAVEG